MTALSVIPGLAPNGYRCSPLHADGLDWIEKNCYIDVWIEVVHALGLDPFAMLPFVVAIDHEGDQWTFFKPPHDELRELYGLDIQELNVWRPLIDHVSEHLAAGKMISTEADAYWLPDTRGTDYRTQHTKTTIVIQHLDTAAERLGYFHNAGYHELADEDFRRLFRQAADDAQRPLPLYAEFARVDRLIRRTPAELRAVSRDNLHRHLSRLPATNPVIRFGQRFGADLEMARTLGLATYHAWAFATVRQLGAAAELAALYLQWLGAPEYEDATASFRALSGQSRTLLLKAARAVNARRELDARMLLDEMAASWDRAMSVLRCG